MSRSLKHTPVQALHHAGSDKEFKKSAHASLRRREHVEDANITKRLKANPSLESSLDCDAPALNFKKATEVESSPKVGKKYVVSVKPPKHVVGFKGRTVLHTQGLSKVLGK